MDTTADFGDLISAHRDLIGMRPLQRLSDDYNSNVMVGEFGPYEVRLALNSNRIRVVTVPNGIEVFNRIHGVAAISDWVVNREDRVLISLRQAFTAEGHEVIWLVDATDDNWGIGLNLTTGELTDWGPMERDQRLAGANRRLAD